MSQEKVQVAIDETGEGIEIKQGVVELDINVVQENVSVEVNNRVWFSISFSGVYRFLGGITTGCLNLCRKPAVQPPVIEVVSPSSPNVATVAETEMKE